MNELSSAIEAILFAAGESVPIARISLVLGVEESLVEAAAAGLPIICTDRCGARFEVVNGNGVVVKSGNTEALASAMHKIENMSVAARLTMGAKGKALAQPYSCKVWADRVIDICRQLAK